MYPMCDLENSPFPFCVGDGLPGAASSHQWGNPQLSIIKFQLLHIVAVVDTDAVIQFLHVGQSCLEVIEVLLIWSAPLYFTEGVEAR